MSAAPSGPHLCLLAAVGEKVSKWGLLNLVTLSAINTAPRPNASEHQVLLPSCHTGLHISVHFGLEAKENLQEPQKRTCTKN